MIRGTSNRLDSPVLTKALKGLRPFGWSAAVVRANQTPGIVTDKRSRTRLEKEKCRFNAVKPCELIFRRIGFDKDPAGEGQYGNEHMDFDGLVVDHDGFLAEVNLHVITQCGFVVLAVLPDGFVLQTQRLAETLKLPQSDPDALFLQITLDDCAIAATIEKFLPHPLPVVLQPSSLGGFRSHDRFGTLEVLADGVAGKSRQFGDSTDGEFVSHERFELNDICFVENIFETKMWTFAHCARFCLTHFYPWFGMA